MPATITINGADRTADIRARSIEVSDSIPARSDTLQFEMVLTTTDIANRPEAGNEISLVVDSSNEFAGEVTSVEETHLINPDTYNYQVTCNDWSRRMDRLLVVIQEIVPTVAGDVVKQILKDFAPEFAVDLTKIKDGVLVPEQQFNYVAVTAILDQMANLSGFVWFVDFNKVVNFTDPPSHVSPLTGNVYDVDTDVKLGDFNWNEDISQLKNRIFLKDASVPDADSRDDTFISDGTASFFKLFQEPKDVASTTVKSTAPDGTVTQWNVALDPLTSDTATLKGPAGTVFLCILNIGLRFPLDDDGKVRLQANEVIEVTTTPMREDIVFLVEDIDSQQMMADRENCTWNVQGCGIFEHVETLGDVRLGSQEAAENYGRLILNQVAWPEVNGTFITQQLKGWKAGQTFNLSSSKRDLFDTETYWKSGQVTKIDIPVWAVQVSKKFLSALDDPDGVVLETSIEFANRALPG